MQYKTYSTKYVQALERATGVLLLLVGILIPVLGYQLTSELVGGSTGIPKVLVDREKEQAKKKARIEELLQDKRTSEARAFVKKINPALSWTTVEKIVRKEQAAAIKHGVPLQIGLAVSWQESTFKPAAKSPTGPIGLKQVAYSHWNETCRVSSREELMRLDKNIDCGYRALAQYKKRYGTWEMALYHYHGHPTDFNLNRKYSLTVLARARKIHTLIMT